MMTLMVQFFNFFKGRWDLNLQRLLYSLLELQLAVNRAVQYAGGGDSATKK